VRAEQPPLSEVAERLFVVRPHYGIAGNQHGGHSGIWEFLPGTRDYLPVAPLVFIHQDGNERSNSGSYLAGAFDHLVFQGWPGHIDYDAVTTRTLRRYRPFRALFGADWVLQGPVVQRPSGGSPAHLAFPLCRWTFMSNDVSPVYCDPIVFAGSETQLSYGSDRLLLSRVPDPADEELTLARDLRADLGGELETWRYPTTILSHDPERAGVWLAEERATGLSFFPVTGDGVGPLASSYSVSLPTVVGRPGGIMSWFYHPARHRFFAVIAGMREKYTPDGLLFASFDTNFQLLETYATTDNSVPWSNTRIPDAFAALPGTLPANFEQAIPIIADTPGANGTYWSSELWLFNPSAKVTTIRVRRVSNPDAERTVDLLANASVRIPDALAWVGGGSAGDGVTHDALVLTSPYRWGEQVVAVSRSSTPAPEPDLRAAGGTLGHAVTAVPTHVGYTNHLDAIDPDHRYTDFGHPSLVLLDRRDPERYRHNLGVVNDTDEPIQVTLRWGYPRFYYWQVVAGSEQQVSVAPHSTRLFPLEQLFPAEVRDVYPPKLATAASSPCIIWLSMVDNTTGDATFVPFTQLYLPGDDTFRGAIPVVAHTSGENGTFWQTDVYGFHWDHLTWYDGAVGVDEDRPKAWFHPTRPTVECGGLPAGGELQAYLDGTVGMPIQDWIEANTYPGYPPPTAEQVAYTWRTVFPDVVRLFPECAAEPNVRGALELRTGSWMSAWSRTYTTRSDGGTYGEMLPLYPYEGWPVQHFAGIEVSSRFRINLGLFNGNRQHPITHRLLLYAADGTLAAQRELVLQPWQSIQERLETLLGIPVGSLADGTYGLTVLPLDDDEAGVPGRSWAYVSLVDNVTGDPTNWW